MARKLTHDSLVQLVDNVLHPKGRGFTSEEINQHLLVFCTNCPDPAAAMDIVLEAPAPATAKQLVEMALACPPRDIAELAESELPLSHPLRHMRLDCESV